MRNRIRSLTIIILISSLIVSCGASCNKGPKKVPPAPPTESDTFFEYAFSVLDENAVVIICDGLSETGAKLELTWGEVFYALSHVLDNYLSLHSAIASERIESFYSDSAIRDEILEEAVQEYIKLAVYKVLAEDCGFSLSPEDLKIIAEWRPGLEEDYSGAEVFAQLIWNNLRETPEVFDKLIGYTVLRHSFLQETFADELRESRIENEDLPDYFSAGTVNSRIIRVDYVSVSSRKTAESIIEALTEASQDNPTAFDTESAFFGIAEGLISNTDVIGDDFAFIRGSGMMSAGFEDAAYKLKVNEFSAEPLQDGGLFFIMMRRNLPEEFDLFSEDEKIMMRNVADDEVFSAITADYSYETDEKATGAAFSVTGGLETLDIGDIFNRALLEKRLLSN